MTFIATRCDSTITETNTQGWINSLYVGHFMAKMFPENTFRLCSHRSTPTNLLQTRSTTIFVLENLSTEKGICSSLCPLVDKKKGGEGEQQEPRSSSAVSIRIQSKQKDDLLRESGSWSRCCSAGRRSSSRLIKQKGKWQMSTSGVLGFWASSSPSLANECPRSRMKALFFLGRTLLGRRGRGLNDFGKYMAGIRQCASGRRHDWRKATLSCFADLRKLVRKRLQTLWFVPSKKQREFCMKWAVKWAAGHGWRNSPHKPQNKTHRHLEQTRNYSG